MCHPEKTLNLFGVYTLETGTLVIPGESRGPCEAALCHLDPGFRRGTLTCRKGIIAKQVQGDEKMRRYPNPHKPQTILAKLAADPSTRDRACACSGPGASGEEADRARSNFAVPCSVSGTRL